MLPPDSSRLHDFRGTKASVSVESLIRIIRHIRRRAASEGPKIQNIVILVSTALGYGLTRLFLAYAGAKGLSADWQVTKVADIAKARVGLPADYVLPRDRQ